MTLFPLWLMKFFVYGGLLLCSAGVVLLTVLFVIDTTKKRIW